MKDLVFEYGGDHGSRITAWFRKHLRSIELCLNAGFPEAGLALIYSGIDTLGLLAAPSDVRDANRDTFKDWCEKFLLSRLQRAEVEQVTANDLYAARCGVLHTSTPVSTLGREGQAREIWYQFRGRLGVNLITSLLQEPLHLDIDKLAICLTQGGCDFIRDLGKDSAKAQAAADRAQHFLRWGAIDAEEGGQVKAGG